MGMDKSVLTFGKYRTGYNTAWERMPKTRRYMIDKGFKPPGQWDPNNLQDGRMFASPKEVAFITEDIAENILWKAYFEDGATKGQLDDISKMLSFAYQLKTGKVKENFKIVKDTWGNMNPDRMNPPRKSHAATISLEPENVKTALMTGWKEETGLRYPDWCVRYIAFFDWYLNGARSKVDLKRIRHSAKHYVSYSGGWMATEYLGGRAKVEKRLGIREWKAFRTCTCPANHNGLPLQYEQQEVLFAANGNPIAQPTWNTACPLTCWQTIQYQLRRARLTPTRIYPKWSYINNRFTKECFGRGTIIKKMCEFAEKQGANPENLTLSPNGGRKGFGKVCQVHRVPYFESFECHADRATNWRRYQSDAKRDPNFKRRNQSRDPYVCTAAHRRIIGHWNNPDLPVKKEPKPEPKPEPPTPTPRPTVMQMSPELRKFQRLLQLNIQMMGGHSELAKILG